jgi:hypothetical protein
MGLLDDAIREHLEFKRQHGADLDEVARLEDEALGPVVRDDNTVSTGEADAAGDRARGSKTSTERAAASPRPVAGADPVHAGEETAELDMRAVLKLEAASPAPTHADDSLEWEVPGAAARPASGARADAGAEGAAVEEEDAVEDVLEETPDFLRDTPDQERLWFEQQPPRDFDFDK